MMRLQATLLAGLFLAGEALARPVQPVNPAPVVPWPADRAGQASGAADSPVPVTNPGSWVTTSDYPIRALREERDGVAAFRLAIDTQGRPIDCAITASTGSQDLDEATCSLILQRARFKPARDAGGKPMAGTYSNRVRWMIPDEAPRELKPTERTMRFIVETDGSASQCSEWIDGKLADPQPERTPCSTGARFQPFTDQSGQPVRRQVMIRFAVTVDAIP